jgi:hypothetical protein
MRHLMRLMRRPGQRPRQACSHEPEKHQHTAGEQGRHALPPGHCSRGLRHDALPSTALRRHVCYGRQLLYCLYGVVREPHPTTADEMDYRGQGLLLVRRFTHRLHHIKGSRPQVIPFTNQTRLTFDVVLPLWGPRGPRPTPSSARAQRSPLCERETTIMTDDQHTHRREAYGVRGSSTSRGDSLCEGSLSRWEGTCMAGNQRMTTGTTAPAAAQSPASCVTAGDACEESGGGLLKRAAL